LCVLHREVCYFLLGAKAATAFSAS